MYLERLGAIKSQALLQMEKENKKESGGLIRGILKKLTWKYSVYYRNVQVDMWINSEISHSGKETQRVAKLVLQVRDERNGIQ